MSITMGSTGGVSRWLKRAAWLLVFIYGVIPSVLLLIFREPEISATVGENLLACKVLLLIGLIVFSPKFGFRRGFVPYSAVVLGVLKHQMDSCLWSPPPDMDLSGRVAIISGGNSGLGLATAKILVSLGAQVVITCRSATKCGHAAKDIASGSSDGRGGIATELLDLSDLQSVHEFTERMATKYSQVDYLFCNAGSTPRYQLTKDGLEDGFGSMHIGHMALTIGLLPLLRRAGEISETKSRVIMVSSDAGLTTASLEMVTGKPAFHPSLIDDINGEGDLRGEEIRGDGTILGSFAAYARAKLSNILFANELNRRLTEVDWPVVAHSLHTGGVNTKSSSSALKGIFTAIPGGAYVVSEYLMPITWRKVEDGARILVYAALGTSPKSLLQGGQYIDGLGRPAGDSNTSERIKALRQADAKWSKPLWAISIGILRDSPFKETLDGSPLSTANL